MFRLLTAPLACILLVSCLAIGFGAGPVSADTTYLITAWPANPTLWSGFSLQYIDKDNDGLFSLNELVPGSFSGVWKLTPPQYSCALGDIAFPRYYGAIVQSPAAMNWVYCGIFDGTQTWLTWGVDGSGYYAADTAWLFKTAELAPLLYFHPDWVVHSNAESPFVTDFGYSQTPVPLPPSVYLLGAGLMGLAAARRKKRSGP